MKILNIIPFLTLSIILITIVYFFNHESPEEIAYRLKIQEIDIRNKELSYLEKLYDISSELNYEAEKERIDSILKAELGHEYERLRPVTELDMFLKNKN